MHDTHDFAGALEWFEACCKEDKNELLDAGLEISDYYLESEQTIQTALRIADRLQRGDVSKTAESKGVAIRYYQDKQNCKNTKELFKAMAQRLIKECGDG